MTDDLLVEVRDRVGILTLNRPDKLNALSLPMNAKAVETLRAWAEDPAVGAILITGAGRGFCAGGDVGRMAEGVEMGEGLETLEQEIDTLRRRHEFPWLLHSIGKPTLAAINGPAAGAGLGLALSCDLRVLAEGTRLSTAYARVGYAGDYGTTWQLTRLVGPARAKELMFFADRIEAEEALRLGLVNRVLPAEGFQEAALALATRLAHGPLLSYRYMKGNINAAVTADFRTILDREAETHLRCGQSADHAEGVKAFLEKREPVFTGR